MEGERLRINSRVASAQHPLHRHVHLCKEAEKGVNHTRGWLSKYIYNVLHHNVSIEAVRCKRDSTEGSTTFPSGSFPPSSTTFSSTCSSTSSGDPPTFVPSPCFPSVVTKPSSTEGGARPPHRSPHLIIQSTKPKPIQQRLAAQVFAGPTPILLIRGRIPAVPAAEKRLFGDWTMSNCVVM